MQECITLVVFIIYAFAVYRETLKWNNVVAMLLVLAAVCLTFWNGDGRQKAEQKPVVPPSQQTRNNADSK